MVYFDMESGSVVHSSSWLGVQLCLVSHRTAVATNASWMRRLPGDLHDFVQLQLIEF